MPFWGGICYFTNMIDAFTTINLPLILHKTYKIPNLSNSPWLSPWIQGGVPCFFFCIGGVLPLWPLHCLCEVCHTCLDVKGRVVGSMFFSRTGMKIFCSRSGNSQTVGPSLKPHFMVCWMKIFLKPKWDSSQTSWDLHSNPHFMVSLLVIFSKRVCSQERTCWFPMFFQDFWE